MPHLTSLLPRLLSLLATVWLCLSATLSHAGQLTTRYSYDEAGNKTSQTDAQGRVTRWSYTLTNQVASRTLPDGKRESYTYDDLGQVTAHTDFAGQTTRYAYDVMGRPTTVTHPDGRTVRTSYTLSGQVESVTETRLVNGKPVSETTRYAYDINDRLLKLTYPDNRFISYGYDLAGNITSRSTVNGTTSYEYDVMNRLAKVTDSRGGVTTYTYDAAGRLLTTTYPNGTDGLREYDDNGHLLQVAWRQTATGQVVTATRYTLLPNGMRETLTRFDGQSSLQVTNAPGANGQSQAHWELGNAATTIAYTYDSLQRLTGEHQVSHRQDSPYQELTNRWTYDSTGNRLTQEHTVLGWSGGSSVETTSYRYDSRDRLQDSTLVTNTGSSVTTTYDWDDNGRLVRKTSPGEVTLYGWRSDDRLLWVKRGATEASAVPVAAYDYNVDGIRVRRTAGDGTVTDYLTDPNFTYAQTLEESEWGGSVSGKRLTRYEWGNALIAGLPVGDGQGSRERYYHQDGLGSVVAFTSWNAFVSGNNYYDAFGGMTAGNNGYYFSGEYFDVLGRIYFNRSRWYDQNDKSFITSDPFVGDKFGPKTLADYAYAGGDPVNYNDPSGEATTVADLMVGQNIQVNISRARFKRAADEIKAVANSICKATSRVGDIAEHHAFPVFMGGTRRQRPGDDLVVMDAVIHQDFHRLLNLAFILNGLPSPNTSSRKLGLTSREIWEKIYRGRANPRGLGPNTWLEAFTVVLDVSDYVDKTCQAAGVRPYDPIYPKISTSMRKWGIY